MLKCVKWFQTRFNYLQVHGTVDSGPHFTRETDHRRAVAADPRSHPIRKRWEAESVAFRNLRYIWRSFVRICLSIVCLSLIRKQLDLLVQPRCFLHFLAMFPTCGQAHCGNGDGFWQLCGLLLLGLGLDGHCSTTSDPRGLGDTLHVIVLRDGVATNLGVGQTTSLFLTHWHSVRFVCFPINDLSDLSNKFSMVQSQNSVHWPKFPEEFYGSSEGSLGWGHGYFQFYSPWKTRRPFSWWQRSLFWRPPTRITIFKWETFRVLFMEHFCKLFGWVSSVTSTWLTLKGKVPRFFWMKPCRAGNP